MQNSSKEVLELNKRSFYEQEKKRGKYNPTT